MKADGTVTVWGDNTFGQTNIPPDLSNVVAIAAGWYHSLAVKADGTIAPCDTNSTVPQGLTNAIAVGAGLYHNLALKGVSPPLLHAPMVNPKITTTGFRLFIPTQSGKVYRLEYENSLTNSNWTALGLVAGNGGLMVLSDPENTNSQRFYRVRQW